jgi:two-component system sensor kinase FixL
MEDNSLLKAIIDHAIDGIITINERGNIESVNPAACRMFRFTEDELLGENVSVLMPVPDQPHHNGFISKYLQTGKSKIIGTGREVTGKRKDGSLFPCHLGINEINYGGKKIYSGFIHDLSPEKDAERTISDLKKTKEEISELLKNEKELGLLKTRFVTMASHEFRTPLSVVQLAAELILRYNKNLNNANIEKQAEKIKNSVGNMVTILNDFLSLEKLESGNVRLTIATFDILQFSEEIIEEMKVMTKPNQHIIYEHTGTSRLVETDRSLLKNCVFNLVSNAIKYSGDNTFIEFNTAITDTYFHIMIRDNGIGIPESEQKHLFEAFFRAHNTGNVAGTGLGLNIVARYTSLLNGRIDFQSKINEGTSLTISFPISHEKNYSHN